ncbi:MAG TPA: polysaccharide biosynthesis/export family protein [Allosphingosinicella sp.]|nr:polysaccharide biosynthesis/export family protein [Allosphingosinicella sp.]
MAGFSVFNAVLRLLAIALLGLSLNACMSAMTGGSGGKSHVPTGTTLERPDNPAAVVDPASHRIGVSDKLSITVFQVPDLSGEFQVDQAGNISLPLIGSVQAMGRTPPELGKLIEEKLGATYLRNPNVQVAVKEATPQTFTVDGSVKNPGVYPILGQTTLIKAVASASGTSEDADPTRVVVFRQINGQRMAAAFNLAAIRRGNAEDPPIYGNDIVVVDGSKARALYKDLLQAFPLFAIFRPF